jgi:hypothetical protein
MGKQRAEIRSYYHGMYGIRPGKTTVFYKSIHTLLMHIDATGDIPASLKKEIRRRIDFLQGMSQTARRKPRNEQRIDYYKRALARLSNPN